MQPQLETPLQLVGVRLQPQVSGGLLSALRREQKRREDRGARRRSKREQTAAGAVANRVADEEETPEGPEVELGDDPTENAYFVSKAMAGDEAVPEPVDLTQFIVPASERLKRREAQDAKNAIRQNKATADADDAQPRGDAVAVAPESAVERRPPAAPQPPAQNEPTAEAAHGASGGAEDEASARFNEQLRALQPWFPRWTESPENGAPRPGSPPGR